MPSVLITGASGFVGRVLCRRFAEAGWSVTAAAHRAGVDVSGVSVLPVGDISGEVDWARWLDGVEVLVHSAARAHVTAPAVGAQDEYRRINTVASTRLFVAARAARVSRFVYLSSAKVLGEASAARPFRDDDRPAPQDPYAESKAAAETALRTLAAEAGPELVVLRPPLVYGPGVKANFLSLLGLADTSWPLPFAGIRNRRSLIYVDNLADACVRAAGPGSPQGAWLVSDGQAMSTAELVAGLRRRLGRGPRLIWVPETVLRLAGAAAGQAHTMARLLGSFEVDSSPFARAFAWTPPWAVDTALDDTVSWYRKRRGQS